MTRSLVLTLVLGAVAAPAAAQDCTQLTLTRAHVEAIDAVYNPVLAHGDDDARRQQTRMIIEQLAYEHPGEGWVWKSADPGRPPSKDALARMFGARLCIWDWQNGSTRRRAVDVGTPAKDATGQNPIVLVGVNHRGGLEPSSGQPKPAPVVVPAGLDLSEVYRYVAALEQRTVERDERMFADERARWQQLATQLQALQLQVERHDSQPGWLTRRLTSGSTYAAAIAAVIGWYAQQRLSRPEQAAP